MFGEGSSWAETAAEGVDPGQLILVTPMGHNEADSRSVRKNTLKQELADVSGTN